MKFCINCGAQLDPDDKFCTSCGKSVDSSPVPPGQQSKPTPGQYTQPVPPVPPVPPGQQPGSAPGQYTAPVPPVSPGHQPGPIPSQYTSPIPPVQQTYVASQQNAGQPSYHPGASQNQSFASPGASGTPQPQPGGNNPFTQFSQEMNTGNIQRKTQSRGMLLGGILGLILLAVVICVVVIALRPKGPSGGNNDGLNGNKAISASISNKGGSASVSNKSSSASISKDTQKETSGTKAGEATPSSQLSNSIKTNAQLSDIVGTWEGTIKFSQMEGFDKIPAEDLPPNMDMKAEIAKIMASPAPMTIEFKEDGNWELEVEIVTGMLISSRDYDKKEFETSPLSIKKFNNGTFNIDYTEKDDKTGDKAQILLSGSVIDEKGSLSIKGTFFITLTEKNMTILEKGEYTVFPKQKKN